MAKKIWKISSDFIHKSGHIVKEVLTNISQVRTYLHKGPEKWNIQTTIYPSFPWRYLSRCLLEYPYWGDSNYCIQDIFFVTTKKINTFVWVQKVFYLESYRHMLNFRFSLLLYIIRRLKALEEGISLIKSLPEKKCCQIMYLIYPSIQTDRPKQTV